MNHSLKPLIVGMLLTTGSQAFAASSVDLTVKGLAPPQRLRTRSVQRGRGGLRQDFRQSPITTATTLAWRPEHGVVPMRNGETVTGQNLSLQIEASAWAFEDALRVRDAVTWDTSGLFDATGAGRSNT
ncbi:MAG: hypothetical protein GAK32_02729 [Pseudomonas fluorescens]|nr:MAG: hypothetical protein GAK32_02729 [Pseudomonas fluorescens]